MRRKFQNYQRVAIKAGTSILTSAGGRFSHERLAQLGGQILKLLRAGKETVLISSGAIACGMDACNLKRRPREMAMLQACAAIGQGKLMHAYEHFFSHQSVHTAQVLLTRDGLESRDRFLKVRQTFDELLKMKVLPIVNENDTVSTDEIAFGDNDVLSVQVAHVVQADILIILSDVDGFYLKDGTRVRQVSSEEEIDQELVKHLKKKKNEKTVGGMKSKLEAARIAMRLGLPLIIVNGHDAEIIDKVFQGQDVGTVFMPSAGGENARKKWIGFSAARTGSIIVDQGAYQALHQNKRSLLASGILRVTGHFNRKQVVELETDEGRIFGRGVVQYTSKELAQIAGKKSNEIKMVLGYKHRDEVIHRDDLVIW